MGVLAEPLHGRFSPQHRTVPATTALIPVCGSRGDTDCQALQQRVPQLRPGDSRAAGRLSVCETLACHDAEQGSEQVQSEWHSSRIKRKVKAIQG